MKVKLQNTGALVHTRQDQVRVNDLNYGNHVGHQTIYEYCHDARLDFFQAVEKSLEVPVSELAFGPFGLIMSQSIANYLAQMNHQQEFLVDVFLDNLRSASFDLSYLIREKNSDKALARVLTSMTCFDYQKNKVVAIPQEIHTEFGKRVALNV